MGAALVLKMLLVRSVGLGVVGQVRHLIGSFFLHLSYQQLSISMSVVAARVVLSKQLQGVVALTENIQAIRFLVVGYCVTVALAA